MTVTKQQLVEATHVVASMKDVDDKDEVVEFLREMRFTDEKGNPALDKTSIWYGILIGLNAVKACSCG